MQALILGGAGFIGRHVAAALAARGHTLTIGSRRPRRAARRLAPVGRVACVPTRLETLLSAAAWSPLLADVDVVVNAVGILRERGAETYERIHHLAPKALAEACAARGARLVHLSALGLHAGARSRFITSKLFGEAALMASAADFTIVRPSLLDGDDGFGSRWIRAAARLPLHLVPACATGRIAALDVDDLGEAVARLCEPGGMPRRIVELGGTSAWTMEEYLALLRAERTARPAAVLPVPEWIARAASHLFDVAHFSPLSFGHLELLRRDNVPAANSLVALLGRKPRAIGRPAATPPIRPARIPGAAGHA